MTLSIDEKKSIIAYRIQKSYMCMIESKDNAQLGLWSLAANRLYYSVFYMASALLTDKGFVARTHSGVIHLLGSEFVAKGLLSGQEGHFYLTYIRKGIAKFSNAVFLESADREEVWV